MGMIIFSVAVLAIAIMVMVSQRQSVSKIKTELKSAQEKTISMERTLANARDELRKSKDELDRGKNALKDARELAKKKLRRNGLVDSVRGPGGGYCLAGEMAAISVAG